MTNSSKHPFYIMIATAGRPDLLERTLRSLAECKRPARLEKVLVIENGDRRGAYDVVEAVKHLLPVQYMFVEQANKSAALNAGLECIDDGLIYFTDDDVRFDPDVLIHYEAAAEQSGPGHYFGGPCEVDYESPPPHWLIEYLPPSAKGWSPTSNSSSLTFLGCNWAAFTNDLKGPILFDTNRGPSCQATGQETEMQTRLLRQGLHSRYIPHATVWHYVPPDRCSPEWALNRAYRNGSAIRRSVRFYNFPTLEAPVRTLWWILYPRWILSTALASITYNDQQRFHAMYLAELRRGVLHALQRIRRTGQ